MVPITRGVFCLGLLAVLSAPVPADEPTAAEATSAGVTVLLNNSFWRVLESVNGAWIKKGEGLEEQPWPRGVTLYPAAGWAEPLFDDSSWDRRAYHVKYANGETDGRAGGAGQSTSLRQLNLRGRFAVTDPAAVKGLSLSMAFRGGAVVYLNGKELKRAFLPAGAVAHGSPAEAYPEAAFLKPDGNQWSWWTDSKEIAAGSYAHRVRRLTADVPAGLLRKGVNVLAVEIHAAPHILPAKTDRDTKLQWSTCGLVDLRMAAGAGGGLVPNVARPAGLQVWNTDIAAGVFTIDYGDPNEPLRPIAIVAARNGSFSGRIVLGNDQPIRGLQAKITDLTGSAGGKIPAAAVEVGYGTFDAAPSARWGGCTGEIGTRYPGVANLLREEGILRSPPAVPGAVQPVWVTVHVPTQAATGEYRGTLTVTCDSQKPVEVPVMLTLADWTLPDPADYVYWAGFIQSPEGPALAYGLPLWSDKAWEYTAKSLEYLGRIGNKVLFIMLDPESQYGNAESMVRWTKGGDGKYTHDFSRVEKYVDLAVKHMGKPRFVVVGVWNDCGHLSNPAETRRNYPKFTVEDAATHAVTTENGPPNGTAENETFWRPVLTGVKAILDKRGLGEAMLLGYSSDTRPDAKTVAVFHRILPKVGWQSNNHIPRGYATVPIEGGGDVPILYFANVWGGEDCPDPDKLRNYGWSYLAKGEDPRTVRTWIDREWYPASSLVAYRVRAEAKLLAGRRGVGQIGVDLWNAPDKDGRMSSCMVGRFPGTHTGNLSAYMGCMLYPAPDGPAPRPGWRNTVENIQEAEARIFLEKLILDKKLPEPLAKKCQDVLDERTRWVQMYKATQESAIEAHWVSSNWPARTLKLFAAAGEAAKASSKEAPGIPAAGVPKPAGN